MGGGQLVSVLKSFDAFRTPSNDITVSSPGGSFATLVSVCICFIAFLFQLWDFMEMKLTSHLELDSSEDVYLRVNFDLTMLEIPCEFLTISVWDTYGSTRVNVSRNIIKTHVDSTGDTDGHLYTDDELTQVEFSSRQFTAEQLAEANMDWNSQLDSVEHNSLLEVLEAHEFTLVMFCSPELGPCQLFKPLWKYFSVKLNEKTFDLFDANQSAVDTRAFAINCAEDAFSEVCLENQIMSFPTIRLYRRSVSNTPDFAEIEFSFPSAVTEAAQQGHIMNFTKSALERLSRSILGIAQDRVEQFNVHASSKTHSMFKKGCRIQGHVEVPKVPCTLTLQAAKFDKSMNPAFTNVSHHVHRLSFGTVDTPIGSLPSEVLASVNPMDDLKFVVEKFHTGPHHYIKILHTQLHDGTSETKRFYQLTHQWNFRKYARQEIPKAKLSFDTAPLELYMSLKPKRWYDFLTSIFAIVGGFWACVSMAVSFGKWLSDMIK
eukprot:gnl/MRDRNA2_/MRDRNA2_35161_c0_seq1.p1 gnl/MRDRNA2_/MRDRNA2_35161_c0~~gnl/MRDRNA2_/MRDRNA2_35161_c0_seq1.p1  ORF type:complete len:488 (-),score=59.28 gnl/MRDRNA2_/MRDRNA2_35161_c0_seq1:68-1531(-)